MLPEKETPGHLCYFKITFILIRNRLRKDGKIKNIRINTTKKFPGIPVAL